VSIKNAVFWDVVPCGFCKNQRFAETCRLHLQGRKKSTSEETKETEREGHLAFLYIDIYRRPNGSLDHRVYRKPIHTSLYLNVGSHHHPSNRQAMLSTLVHRAGALCDEGSLNAELVFLMAATTGRFTLSTNIVQISANR
jgi:hypothetical protein